jgi:hypothetical protein
VPTVLKQPSTFVPNWSEPLAMMMARVANVPFDPDL